MVNKDFEY